MDHASAKEFTCDSIANPYLDVHKAMTKEIRGLIPPWWVQRPENLLLNPKSVTMTKIAKASVLNCMQFPQNPSASLVRALMDLVDLEGGNEFKTVRDGEGDRGGAKCMLLMTNNYLAYYLPPQSLQPKNALRIVPTVTYWHEDTMWWQDASTSNVATYTIPLKIAIVLEARGDRRDGAFYRLGFKDQVAFADMIAYCIGTSHARLGPLPDRRDWGSVNPVLLMEDRYKPSTGKTRFSHMITSRGVLSAMSGKDDRCYHEVFLPGRPGHTEQLLRGVGKIARYARPSGKPKISLRALWYLPVELCSASAIKAYGTFLQTLVKTSLGYAYLSSPKHEGCGLCWARRGNVYAPKGGGERVSAIDKTPYAVNKCVTLPNCCKADAWGTRPFRYILTHNAEGIEDPGFEGLEQVSVGLSSIPILSDLTSLGPECHEEVQDDRVSEAKAEAEKLWGVPVTVERFCASQYPCPLHSRVHRHFKLRAAVTCEGIVPICFVA
ncbi:hypothetical protein AAFF_G00171570 [Aldrovandia affinis]|uniref:Uncharacterized protein n=1 Tax=Aldrovandia affinis TaxID=143900 RepID=A0AAD7SYK7_9TELE|nr:hypothetical protein AAFF_G00171570 [Aldrovandia affinis]